jgi:hypothetical protein
LILICALIVVLALMFVLLRQSSPNNPRAKKGIKGCGYPWPFFIFLTLATDSGMPCPELFLILHCFTKRLISWTTTPSSTAAILQ